VNELVDKLSADDFRREWRTATERFESIASFKSGWPATRYGGADRVVDAVNIQPVGKTKSKERDDHADSRQGYRDRSITCLGMCP